MPKEGAAKNDEVLDQFCRDHEFVGWFYTSAKDNINVDEASKFLVAKVRKKFN